MNEITVEARLDKLDEVLAFVDAQLEAMDCPIKAQTQIDIAVEEMFVNIAHYAYGPEVGQAVVRFEARQDPPAAAITFVDRGAPFDPTARHDPDVSLPVEQRQIGGLGIYMTKKSMDGMTYERWNGKNILTIEKRL